MKIEVHGISKKYLLKTALDGVTVSFDSGKIHALVGDNGAGKSTLASIISGNTRPTEGSIIIDGNPATFSSPRDALSKGIVLVHQRPNLASSLKVKENIALSLRYGSTTNNQTKIGFLLKFPTAKLDAYRQTWAPELNINAYVKDIGGNQRFYVSLLGSLLRNPTCLILDEPSAFLDEEERKRLYSNLQNLKKQGTTIIVITHSIAEATTYADTVTVLKDGKLSAVYSSGSEYMGSLSKNKTSIYFPETVSESNSKSSPAIIFENASSKPKNRPVLINASFSAPYGKITAITGLKEAALDTLEDLVTGMETAWSFGTVHFYSKDGKKTTKDIHLGQYNPKFLRKNNIAIVPSDRTYIASNPNLTVEQMLSAFTNKNKRTNALTLINNAGINITPEQKVSSLSGGMLQRLILERELHTNPGLIILCNPMQGLDIESQGKLCKRITETASKGSAVLIIGAMDFPLSTCSKVYEMESGTLKLAFSKGEEK